MKIVAICGQHLDEFVSLHLHRKSLLSFEEFGWVDVAEFEERFLAHLDGILENGPEGVEAVIEFLTSEDEAEVFAAAFALASTGAKENIAKVIHAMTEAKELLPFVEALQLARAEKLGGHLIPLLADKRPEMRAAVAQVLGYRREEAGKELVKFLDDPEPGVVAAAAEALGRLKETSAQIKLEKLIGHKEPQVEQAALLALLRMGSNAALARLRELSKNTSDCNVYTALALAGEGKDFSILASPKNLSEEAIEALGIFGNIDAVPVLLNVLSSGQKELHLPSANALELLTWAGLWEKVKVVEEVDFGDGDVVKEEKEMERPSVSHQAWSDWWKENQKKFDTKLRWRLGKPFDFGVLIDELENPKNRLPRRRLAGLELAIRSGQNFAFEPDWLVVDQRKSLEQWRLWWQKNQPKFKPGGWPFGGK
jgi:uncharacterized protein (TIGR02270 family)